MVPHIVHDPDYLAKKGFEVVDSRQNVVSTGTVTREVLGQLRAGKLFIRQKPGPKNSLGLVKFVFPNSYNVYMHDTPRHEFFAKSRRDFSHGCIRLEKPADLAAWVLRDNPGLEPGPYSRGHERHRDPAGESRAPDSGLDRLCHRDRAGRRSRSLLRRHLRARLRPGEGSREGLPVSLVRVPYQQHTHPASRARSQNCDSNRRHRDAGAARASRTARW